ncbi:RNA polymerase sigma factor [Fluviicola sp.]|uniref:RNA polymerase sigma factor n=1 Tax=Fluviicola sp. TaxID=1917219 RepID=UPI003D268967
MTEDQLISQLYKTEYRKIVSVLCKLVGIAHVEIAEDIGNDTFLLASETWKLKGLPENPTAWLYTVAKNKTKDYFKRHKTFTEKISVDLRNNSTGFESLEVDLSPKNISDSQLQMIFAVCNPVISTEAQIGLALRILCGFGINEIADAFLSNKETINKRLFRAKETLRKENSAIEFPSEAEIPKRLETVLTTLYLLFNEGYYSNNQTNTIHKEFCLEAMRLTYLLLENESTNQPIVNALMSLMCFQASRLEARTSETGENILYDEQDQRLWNDELISRGNHFLIASAKGQEISKYHLEASIAYWHSTKTVNPDKWENILQLYNKLLQIDYSPIVALNRTYALSKATGKETAIVEAEKLKLNNNHLYFSLLGNLYTDVDNEKALENYREAYKLAPKSADKLVLSKIINELKEKSN